MDRRGFIRRIGCGCALAAVGCATHRKKAKDGAVGRHERAGKAD